MKVNERTMGLIGRIRPMGLVALVVFVLYVPLPLLARSTLTSASLTTILPPRN